MTQPIEVTSPRRIHFAYWFFSVSLVYLFLQTIFGPDICINSCSSSDHPYGFALFNLLGLFAPIGLGHLWQIVLVPFTIVMAFTNPEAINGSSISLVVGGVLGIALTIFLLQKGFAYISAIPASRIGRIFLNLWWLFILALAYDVVMTMSLVSFAALLRSLGILVTGFPWDSFIWNAPF